MNFQILFLLFYVSSLFVENYAAKILVISAVSSKSMKTFLQSIAESLAERGHQVIGSKVLYIFNRFV